MSLPNLSNRPTPKETPQLHGDGMDSHQTLCASNSQGPGAPNERICAAMTALAHHVGELSTENKHKLVTKCHHLGIPGNMNVVQRTL